MQANRPLEHSSYLTDPQRESQVVSRHARREISGSIVVLAGIFVLVSLLVGEGDGNLIGPVGEAISSAIRFMVGGPMSFLVPVGIVWLGIGVFRGKLARWSSARIAGMLLVLAAMTGMLALPGADVTEMRLQTFERAGALGTYLVEWDGLRLVGQFGTIGALMILLGCLLVGSVLTTNLGLSTIASTLCFWRTVPVEGAVEEDEDTEPAVAPKAKKLETPLPVVPNEPTFVESKPGFFARFFGGFGRSEGKSNRRASILCDVDEPTGWDDVADEDVAAVARALEVHELESRVEGRMKIRVPAGQGSLLGGLVETPTPIQKAARSNDDTSDDELEAFKTMNKVTECPTEDESLEEDEEIIFTDNSGPLPIKEGNPGNLGESLARMFPTRWPKQGTPAKAMEDLGEYEEESQEEVFDKSEARQLRRTMEAAAGANDTQEDDPLFASDIDTRPYGPNGEPLDVPVTTPQPPMSAVYRLPDIQLLSDPPMVDARMTRDEVLEMSSTLTQTLADFGIDGKVTQVHQGPVVTRFEFRPAAGIKVSRIVGLEHDIAMGMRALSVRILAPIPGKNAVGIEVPNQKRQGVYLKELISCEDFWEHKSPLAFALGKTIDGKPYFADLAKMPHLLIAGATGAGKSVCLNTIICSMLYRQNPDKVKFIMVDPKRVELSVYGDIPHLLAPVVCDGKRAAAALDWAVEQMEERYKTLVEFGVRNIDGYNRIAENPEGNKKAIGRSLKPMPYMVIIVDELADLMVVAKAEVEESIQRLAQMARAVGIHLILATQRPSVNVITGIIKANFPSRIAFQVSQKVDSRTILDSNGAEALLGRGDMLLSSGGAGKPIRVQGAFLSDEEVEHIADHCRAQWPVEYEVEEFEPKLSEKEQRELAKMMGVSSMEDLAAQDRMVRGTNKVMGKVTAGMFMPHEGGSASAGDDEIDEALVRAAARLILESRKASVSLLQRRLKVGFARAGRMMDMLEEMGIVGEFQGSKPREIVVDPEAALEQLDRLEMALKQGVSVEAICDADDEDDWETMDGGDD